MNNKLLEESQGIFRVTCEKCGEKYMRYVLWDSPFTEKPSLDEFRKIDFCYSCTPEMFEQKPVEHVNCKNIIQLL
jgi:hypothetical protein